MPKKSSKQKNMFQLKVLLQLFLLFIIGCFSSFLAVSSAPAATIQPTHNLLVLQWPLAIFETTLATIKCKRADLPVDSSKVHGLWPSTPRGTDPSFVQPILNTTDFLSVPKQTLKDLVDNWPDILSFDSNATGTKTSYRLFWWNEWNKHGRRQQKFPQNQYYEVVMQLFQETLEINKELVNQFRGTSKAAFTQDMKLFVRNHFNIAVDFKCQPTRRNPRQKLLQEIYFNVTLNGVLQNMTTQYTSCLSTSRVYFI